MRRVVNFCARNLSACGTITTLKTLKHRYANMVDIRVFDCLHRCIECGEHPFCKMRMQIIEEDNVQDLLTSILRVAESVDS